MRVLMIENAPSAPAGLFGEWLVAQGYEVVQVSPQGLPETAAGFDLVVTLGSPNGAYEDLDWVHRQKAFLAREIGLGQPVVGICFGAQIIAEACGGRSQPNSERHAGWIEITEVDDPVFAGPWARWHGDHITPPAGAVVHAVSRGTVQAFSYGSAVGVQFHPEVDEAGLKYWGEKAPSWLAENGVTQAGLEAQSAELVPARAAARDALFRRLVARALANRKDVAA